MSKRYTAHGCGTDNIQMHHSILFLTNCPKATNTPSSIRPLQQQSRKLIILRWFRYESDFNEVFHMDLKRNLQARQGNATAEDMRPLFEKYEFFNPGTLHHLSSFIGFKSTDMTLGLFMGLLVTLLLLSILSVGMSALGSLQVSYGAFDKEMGPAAQKKQ